MICKEAGSRIADTVVDQLFSQVLKVRAVFVFEDVVSCFETLYLNVTHQTRKTVFDYISIHLEVRQKRSSTRCLFNSLLGVW